jgi:CRP-like cAMP-binding protein
VLYSKEEVIRLGSKPVLSLYSFWDRWILGVGIRPIQGIPLPLTEGGIAMHFKQGDLFWGMSKTFVQEAMDTSEKLTCNDGDPLFKEGDAADHFFILIKGRVLLSRGKESSTVHMARHSGELIGWSTLTGRESFSASATCQEPSSLLKFERNTFLGILDKDSENAAILFKRLAETLGDRLLALYPATI